MDWADRMNEMIRYIEDHLDGDIDEAELARITAMPLSLLQRMMPVVADTTLAEYIRRRRLTAAAMELRLSDVKVIDLAVRYGYESPAAFAAAFRRQHGIAPSAVRTDGVRLKHYPRLVFTIGVRGHMEMDTRIVKRDAFRAAGKSIYVAQGARDDISNFWDKCNNDGSERDLLTIGKPPFLGLCYGMDDKGGFQYMIGLETAASELPGELSVVDVPASTWAAFECVGPMPTAMHKVWDRIFTEFLPNSGYAHAGTPDMEVYTVGDTASDDYRSEVWIPIVKKS